MPSWTLRETIDRVRESTGRRSDISSSLLSFWINEAQREVWDQAAPHSASEAIAISSTTANEDKLTLPSDFKELITLSNMSDNHSLLNQVNIDQLVAWSGDSATPTVYAQYDSWLELRPIPDSAYSVELRYRKQMTEMVAESDVPSVATRYRRAVFLKANELVAQHVTLDLDVAQTSHNAYVSLMDATPPDRALRMREQHYLGVGLPRSRAGQRSTYSFDTADD